jgi:hypothetical protein
MNHRPPLSRRHFFTRGLPAAGLLAAVVGETSAAQSAPPPSHPAASPEQNVDPKLLKYELINEFHSPRPEPKRIACGHENTVLIAAGKHITALDTTGVLRSEIALGAPARALAVAADGPLYVSLRDHIEVRPSLSTLNSPPSAVLLRRTGQLSTSDTWPSPADRTWITGLAVGANDLFAADAGNRVIWHYDRSGKLLGRLGQKDPARNIPGLVVPSPFFDIELGSDGLLRAANPGRHQIEYYTRDGALELAWGKPSMALEGFCGCCNPINLALLPDGRVVTCEKGLPRVKVYNARGALEALVAGPECFPHNTATAAPDRPEGIWGGLDVAADARGRIYILDWASGAIRVMAPKANA